MTHQEKTQLFNEKYNEKFKQILKDRYENNNLSKENREEGRKVIQDWQDNEV